MPEEIIINSNKTIETEFKQCIIDYLEGKDISEITKTLRATCKLGAREFSAQGFCRSIPLSQPESTQLNEHIKDILRHLNLSTEKGQYSDLSLYHLLRRLRHEGHERLDFLIDLIDSTRPTASWLHYVRGPTIGAIGLLSISYFQQQHFWNTLDWIIEIIPITYHWAYHYFVQLHNLPIIGMFVQALWLLYYLNDTYEYGSDPSEERLRNLLFRTLAISLNFFAHLISYWAAGALPILPALMFISSSFLDIVASATGSWYKKILKPNTNPNQDLHERANEKARVIINERDRKTLWIKGFYATFVTTLVIIWCALPSNIIVTMIYMLSMWLAFLVKNHRITATNNDKAEEMQKALADEYSDSNKKLEIEKQKDKFKLYVTDISTQLDSYLETTRKSHYQQKMEKLLKKDPFDLETSIRDFNNFAEDYDPDLILTSTFATPNSANRFMTPIRSKRKQQRTSSQGSSLIFPLTNVLEEPTTPPSAIRKLTLFHQPKGLGSNTQRDDQTREKPELRKSQSCPSF